MVGATERDNAPITRAAVIRDFAITAGIGQWGAIQTAAASLGVDVSPVNLHDTPEIEHAVTTFARIANGGLIVTAGPRAALYRNLIIELAARYKLPAVYYERNFVAAGGLISYGPDFIDQYRRAAATLMASSRAKSRPTYQCRHRPSMSL